MLVAATGVSLILEPLGKTGTWPASCMCVCISLVTGRLSREGQLTGGKRKPGHSGSVLLSVTRPLALLGSGQALPLCSKCVVEVKRQTYTLGTVHSPPQSGLSRSRLVPLSSSHVVLLLFPRTPHLFI